MTDTRGYQYLHFKSNQQNKEPESPEYFELVQFEVKQSVLKQQNQKL
jgi:hypothetical protein